jgi:hypothetical protein
MLEPTLKITHSTESELKHHKCHFLPYEPGVVAHTAV